MREAELVVLLAVVGAVACSGDSVKDESGGDAGEAGDGGTRPGSGGSGGTRNRTGGTSAGGSVTGGSGGVTRGGNGQGGNSGRAGAPTGGGPGGDAGDGGDAGAAATAGAGGIGGASGRGTGGATAGRAGGGVGGAGAGGSSAGRGGSGGFDDCAPIPQACSGALPPADGVLVDLSTYVVGSGNWGNAAVGDITGGTTKFSGSLVTPLGLGATNGSLRVTGTLPPTTYAGFVLWFGPCVNASEYSGVAINFGGTANGAVLKLQVQTHENYPADPANSKGACVFSHCATRWTECIGPSISVTIPPPGTTLVLPWAAFGNGVPNPRVTPQGLVGFQFQFECQAETDCALDVSIASISVTEG